MPKCKCCKHDPLPNRLYPINVQKLTCFEMATTRFQPLRIRCIDGVSYQVIYRNHQEHQTPALKFEHLYHSWVGVFKDLEQRAKAKAFRHEFQESVANVYYHHARLQDQLAILREVGVEAKADGKSEDEILIEVQESWLTLASWDYENTCLNVERGYLSHPLPCRFLVLPADLGSWDDSDRTTHRFRLHFLCDFRNNMSPAPRHKHLSNHPGYKLVRRQEFFQTYGRYVLAVLKMVKQGYSDTVFDVPRLDTFKILWGYHVDNHLTRDNIEPLVDKAIDYLEGLYLPQRELDVVLTERESIAIKSFLVDFDGSNALGGLYRYTDSVGHWYWVCEQHVHQQLTAGPMKSLVDFVHCCGGQVDSRKATISIGLNSTLQADQFCTLLKGNKMRFHVISIKLGWKDASRQDLEDLLLGVSAADVRHLELDAGPYGMPLQCLIDYKTDIFVSLMQRNPSFQSVTLLNSPQPQEKYTYVCVFNISVYRVHSRQQRQAGAKHWWEDLRTKSGDFVNAIVSHNIPGLTKATKDLQDLLVKDGYEKVSSIRSYKTQWHGEYDLEKGILRELQLNDVLKWDTSVAPGALESLSTLKVDVDNLDIVHEEVTCIVQASPQLQKLDISLQEDHILERIERTLDMWQDRSNPLQLTLLERENDGRGQIVAKALVHGHAYGSLTGSAIRLHGFDSQVAGSQDWKRGTPAKVEFSQWNSDLVSTPPNDQAAALLDMATNQHPSILTSFVLSISNRPLRGLSLRGLSHVQNILRRSTLRSLHICCTTFDPSLTDCVRQVLLSVQWSTLQSLILSGEAVNEWIQLLVTTTGISLLDLQFQSFRIQGSGRQFVCLTHSSALFVHQLKYWNPSMEVIPENVRLQDDKDWIWF